MSAISRDDLHIIFNSLDKNNQGQVSIHDLHQLLHKIGIQTTSEELEKFVGRASLDFIDFFFFYEDAIKARIAKPEPETDLFKAFKVFDSNGDGYISCEELQSVLSRLGLWEDRSGRDCKDMIGVYDDNSDGVLDFQEFKNMMPANPSSHSQI